MFRHLTIALALLLLFMAAEVVAGLSASSLALISDAGHMLTEAGAVALSLVAMWPHVLFSVFLWLLNGYRERPPQKAVEPPL